MYGLKYKSLPKMGTGSDIYVADIGGFTPNKEEMMQFENPSDAAEYPYPRHKEFHPPVIVSIETVTVKEIDLLKLINRRSDIVPGYYIIRCYPAKYDYGIIYYASERNITKTLNDCHVFKNFYAALTASKFDEMCDLRYFPPEIWKVKVTKKQTVIKLEEL